MSTPHDILAVIFDFDGTLLPDSTTKLLVDHGIDAEKFWGTEAKQLVERGFDPTLAYLQLIKRCVTFTEKTRYLFEINKGLTAAETGREPYLVNKDVSEPKRRIPFKNMIFVGDGLTDIPCFSLIKKSGGTPFGVFEPGKVSSARRAFLDFLKTDRVISCHAAKYRKNDELGSLLRSAVLTRCAQIDVERQAAVKNPL